MRGRGLTIILSVGVAALLLAAPPAFANGFSSWAAVIVAGDSHAHSGAPSEAFDNGRRDIAKALMQVGFTESHIMQFSAQPNADKDTHPGNSDTDAIHTGFQRLATQTGGGCLLYFTSHGSQAGILVGNQLATPREVAQLVDDTCADKTTVIVLSACYSGVFIPALQRDTRMIITAARSDRASFGCGENNRYTFFDECVLQSLPLSRNFPTLAFKVQDCVAAREKAEGVGPPSEPQVSIGSAVAASLTTAYPFSGN